MPATTSVVSFTGPHRLAAQQEHGHQARASRTGRPAGRNGVAASAMAAPARAGPQGHPVTQLGDDQGQDHRREHRVQAERAGVVHRGADQRAHDRAAGPADQHAEAAGPVGGALAREIVLGQGEDHALVVHHVRAEQPPPAPAGASGR